MTLTRRLRQLTQRLVNLHIYSVLPRGIDVAHDIAKSFPTYDFDIVFDVGANVGQSAERYVDCFPGSHIYCFEPVRDTFRQLQDNLKGRDRIRCFQLALGSSRGKGQMALEGSSDMFFLMGQSKNSPATEHVMTEDVDIVTLDDFCSARDVRHVNYLKIDTEGADLEVLRGGGCMLDAQRIDFVEVEAGMHAGNRRHVPFETLKSHLESKGYLLFGIYEQVHEWPKKEPHLRRTNPVFISRRMIETETV
jgi:FkbM family methyltransferase